MIRVYDQTDENSETVVTDEMFGLNALIGVTTPEDTLLFERYQELGVTNLRFPGGSVTEWHFDISDIAAGSHNNSVTTFQGIERDLIPFDQFIGLAAKLDVSTTLVIPTIKGFTKSAGEALLTGTYGQRLIDAAYLQDVADFITAAIATSKTHGVTIEAFEIGNEFWGSGQMTATEYGNLAAAISVVTSQTLSDLGISQIDQPDIVVQTISSAGTFSPNGTKSLYIDEDTYFVFQPSELVGMDDDLVSTLTAVTLPSQGRSREQARDIMAAFDGETVAIEGSSGKILEFDISRAADEIDAVVNHYYVDNGFIGVNTEEQFRFNQFDLWNIELESRTNTLPELEFYITEWNTRKNAALEEANNRGLQQASMSIEIFYEMVTHNVTAANFWPVIFNYSNSGTLIFNSAESLTIAGEGFSLMSQSLVGLEPILDFRIEQEVAIHGFGDDDRLVYFLSERSGSQNQMHLDLSDTVNLDAAFYQVSWTALWDGDAGGVDEMAQPVITSNQFDTLMSAAAFEDFALTMQAWSIVRLEIQAVGTNNIDDVVELIAEQNDNYIKEETEASDLSGEGSDTASTSKDVSCNDGVSSDLSDPAAQLTGLVIDNNGNKLQGTKITFSQISTADKSCTTDESGSFYFTNELGVSGTLHATRSYDTKKDGNIDAGDALDVLRLSVGLAPSWGEAKATDFIAADINQDGKVTASDALAILRIATGLESGIQPSWIFFDSEVDLASVNRENTSIETDVQINSLGEGLTELTITGVLLGNMQEHV